MGDYRMDLDDQIEKPGIDPRQYDDEYQQDRDESIPFDIDMEDIELGNESVQNQLESNINKVDELSSFSNITTTIDDGIIEEFTPPENFSPVIGRIYRSSFPRVENFKFLQKLKLKSILVLVPDEYPKENLEFLEKQGINFFQVGLSGNKEPFVNVPHDLITKALNIVIDPQNHPILIHCNRGKHRTGCLVGCIRRLQGWSLTMIFDEYRRFASPKARPLDQQFIEMYGEEEIVEIATEKGWLPLKW
ncbi:Tyrosine-protein phosphatase SIW14 [Wickerhamomyces ciferrii]|uniref:diphosphoinositol-polyphosphate diphosphatase n=1 Tax=Wickerhamomyces ciferrii (strain ATCC 14091 / BCRC 22168 / CBS 111 / JCM 3599 / NBRC 0793 / NRRL Y-1031 F-60-10) TaxID=1206466 RepID=K0KIM5_WICCF|nr:Tyrosine-protein phosphatase SIW14 [Wickerhamomyces ciferrii]CCH42032.1 Tyrosine-protein phosphatase SIW14 [Wickerhamomyces ciferrii]